MCHCLLVMKAAFFVALVQFSFGQVYRGYKRVNAIELTGSKTFDEATLKNELRKIRVGEWVTSSMVDSDIEVNLKAYLKQFGFMQCEVSFQELPLTEKDVNLHIRISEGPQYRLASLHFTGMTFFNKERIGSSFNLQPGDIVDFSKIKDGLEALRGMYADYGFINWSYIPEQTFDVQNMTVTLSFTIDEGVQHFIAYVAFAGCRDQAEEARLRTQTYEQVGQVFSPTKFQVDALRLKQTGGVVKESMEILDEKKGLVGIVFWLRPGSGN